MVAKKFLTQLDKKLSCRRRTAPRATSVEILSTAVQLYEKSHFKGKHMRQQI